MKKIFLISLLMLILSSSHSFARDINVTLNGSNLEFDQPPIIVDGRTLVPMRVIFEALDCTVEWDNDTREITAGNNDTTVILRIDDTSAFVNSGEVALDVPPQILNNRTLVPIRFVSESLDCDVNWNNETSTVEITKIISLSKRLYSPSTNTIGKYMSTTGIAAENSAYFYTSAIDVSDISTVYFSQNRYPCNVRFVTAFDENMNVLPDFGRENISEFDATGVSYIVVTALQTASQRLMISNNNNADIILPEELCIAFGQSAKIFNRNIISGNAEDYLFTWSCDIGKTEDDGYYIDTNEASIGVHPLTLTVKNPNNKTIFSGKTDIKIVKNTLEQVNILPIGDSLTNNKPWLDSVISLSGKNVTFIGTRGQAPRNHEGRSGFSSAGYLKGTEYTFENEGIHPFWDGTKFNWNYYLEKTGLKPDAVQIFLGTNGLSVDPVKNAESIRAIADEILQSDKDIPIFIINTMHRGTVYDENGEINSNAIAEQHTSIINLAEYLNTILKDYENVHIIPVYATHDSINNYSEKDSVHPTDNGYSTIADMIYGAYCAYLD